MYGEGIHQSGRNCPCFPTSQKTIVRGGKIFAASDTVRTTGESGQPFLQALLLDPSPCSSFCQSEATLAANRLPVKPVHSTLVTVRYRCKMGPTKKSWAFHLRSLLKCASASPCLRPAISRWCTQMPCCESQTGRVRTLTHPFAQSSRISWRVVKRCHSLVNHMKETPRSPLALLDFLGSDREQLHLNKGPKGNNRTRAADSLTCGPGFCCC